MGNIQLPLLANAKWLYLSLGNVMNGPIGKQMVDTLVESSANFEASLKF